MIDHISIPVSDLEAATRHYSEFLETPGYKLLVTRERTAGFSKAYPEFWLNARPGMAPVPQEGGWHVCLRCGSMKAVRAFHETGLLLGGADAARRATGRRRRPSIKARSSTIQTATRSRR